CRRCPMTIVVCPGCGRHIDLPAHELSLPSITCAACDSLFAPADHTKRAGISFACPNCQAPYHVAKERAGWKTNCPRCGQRFQVPTPPSPLPPALSRTILAPLRPEQPAPSPITPSPITPSPIKQ